MIYTREPDKGKIESQNQLIADLETNHQSWVKLATRFRLFACENYPTTLGSREIFLETRDGLKGTKWVVFMDGFVLGKDAVFHYEPIPSSRNDKFINNTRFDNKYDALLALKAHLKKLGSDQGFLTYSVEAD